MTLLERAVMEIADALESMKIDYMIVGGIANAVWGEPRAGWNRVASWLRQVDALRRAA